MHTTSDISVLLPQEVEFLKWRVWAQARQQEWLEKLGDRTCYFINHDNPKPLEMKVGFALFGYPIYNKEQNDKIMKTCSKLQEVSNQMNSDGVYFSVLFLYCFIEANKSKKVEQEEFLDVVFKINKGPLSCEEKFIDSNLRVYESWDYFKKSNKYPECWYLLPRCGKYYGNETGKVILELEQSPASSLLNKVGNILDTGGLILGLGSAAIGIASIFMPVAAPLLVGSVVAAGVSGTYSFGRSVSTLRDRHKHQQSISLMDSEARSAWIELTLSAVAVGVSAGSVMSSVQAASSTGKAAASTATAGEAASSASSVGPQAAAKASKGSRAAARAAARAAKLGKETKVVTAGSKAVSGSKAGKAATNIGKGAAKVARASKLARNTAHLSTGASKAAHEVANASKIAKNAAGVSKRAAKILKSAKNASNVVEGAAKTPSFVKNTVDIGTCTAKASTGGAVKITNEASKAALKAINTGKLTTKAANATAAAKGLKTSKSVANVSKGTGKLVMSSKIVSANVKASKSAAVITTGATNVSKMSKTMSGSKASATNATMYGRPTLTSTSNSTSNAATIITFGYQVLIEIAINENVSNVSLKHRELLEQILILYEKDVNNSIESNDFTQIISHVNFYFNTILKNPIDFLTTFISKLNETINYVYKNGHKSSKKSKEQVQICCSKSSMKCEDILESMFAELQSAEIDWSLFNISPLEDQNLFAGNFHVLNENLLGNMDTQGPSSHPPSCNKWPDIETDLVVSVSENEAGALPNVTGTEDDWETTSEEE